MKKKKYEPKILLLLNVLLTEQKSQFIQLATDFFFKPSE